MTTPLFLLRCVQLGLSIRDLDLLTIWWRDGSRYDPEGCGEIWCGKYYGDISGDTEVADDADGV